MPKQIDITTQPHRLVTGKYLGKKMRKAIMITFIATFFIVSPLLIFYTAGYRYDMIEGAIKQTGVLSIDIKPNDATLFINEVKIEKKMPVRLTNRAPGVYHIRIEKQGYKTWEKDITIQSNQTTFIKDVTLIKDAVPRLINNMPKHVIRILGTGFHDNIVMVTQEENTYEMYLYNTKTAYKESLIRTTSTIEPNISLSPFQEAAYVHFIEPNNEHTLYFFSLVGTEKSTVLTYKDITHIQWNKTPGEYSLFVQSQNNIERISLSGVQNKLLTVSSSIWYVDTNNHTWIYEHATNSITNINTEKKYYISQNIHTIIDINQNRFILQTEEGYLYVYRPDKERLAEIGLLHGSKTYYQRDTQEWWIWSQWELNSVYHDGRINLLERGGKKIKNAMLMDINGVILFVYEDGLTGFNPGYHVRNEIIKTEKSIIDAIAHLRQRKIYYLLKEEDTNNIYTLEY